MPTIIRWDCLLPTLTILTLCTGAGAQGRQEKMFVEQDLKIIVLAYVNYYDETKKGPTKAEDLAPYFENDKRLLETLKSGQIQFRYNVGVVDIVKTTGVAKTILAYEKDLPTKGGYAVFADGSVKKLTAEEFKKTPLAGMK